MRTLVVLVALATHLAAQGGCLDQSFLPTLDNGLEITANQTVTQTFTAGLAGTLATVEVANINHHRGTPTQPLDVKIVATDASGTPNGATLASLVFQPNQVPATRGTLSVDLRRFAIAVLPGTVLGIRLSSSASPGGQTYAWWGHTSDGYAGGMVFLRDVTPLTVWDLSFRTFVGVSATSRSYGVGHAGTNGIPTLAVSANPVLGSTIDLLLGNSSSAASTAALLAGFAPLNVPTPLGGTLLVQITANLTVPLPAAGARSPLTIPNDPSLCTASVFFQAVQLDAGATHAVAFSRGLELVLGE